MKVWIGVKLEEEGDEETLNRIISVLNMYKPHLFECKLENLISMDEETEEEFLKHTREDDQ